MAKTIVGLFDRMDDAQQAFQELINNGFAREDISLVARDSSTGDPARVDTDEEQTAEAAGAGAVGGTVIGGGLGLLVGLGALAIPGIGPVVAAGTLATALGSAAIGAGIGAAAGGIIGALVGLGIPEEDAHLYAEGVRRGGTLVTVQAADDMADTAYNVLSRYNVVDLDERSSAYRNQGWDRFDENAGPYGGDGDSARSNWEESSKVGTAGGAAAGAATGAAMGSVGGPVGTVVGGLAGAAVGAGVGAAGDSAGEAAEDRITGDADVDYTRRDTEPAYSAGSTYTDTTYTDTTYTGDRERGDDVESNWEESSKVGTAVGAAAGAATGAAMGSVGGPVGTVIGGVAGAVAGAGVGAAGDAAGEAAEDSTTYGNTSDVVASNDTFSDQRDSEPLVGAEVGSRKGQVNPEDLDRERMERGEELEPTGEEVYSYDREHGDDPQSNWEESSKVGTGGGAAAGAATGAAMGSVGGPVGTVIGGVAGAVVGAGVGAAGDAAGKAAEDSATGNDTTYADTTYRDNPDRTMGDVVSGDYDRERGDDVQSNWEESSKVGTGGGAAAGAATGAAIGSVGGPVGAVVGGLAGAAAGAGIGAAGDAAGEAAEDHERNVGSYDTFDPDFRGHYDQYSTNSGYEYDQYKPVYQYGYNLGTDSRYNQGDWNSIEGEAQRRWEERNPGTWDRFKDSVRYAWEKASGRA